MQIRIRAKSLKLSVLYCAASRHHCHYVITGNFVIRSFFLYFQKWCFADFSACLWTGKPDAAAVQLLLVPWEHSMKCNAFWQFLSFHLNVVPNSIFSNVPAWGVKHRMKIRGNSTSCHSVVIYDVILDPPNDNFHKQKKKV